MEFQILFFKFHFVDYHSFKNNATARLVCSFHDRSEQASFLNEYRGTSRVDISRYRSVHFTALATRLAVSREFDRV